ncbi:clp protease family protein [[Clostridium] bifermentans ATCC 638]|uniref:ATP-dependent Clp protease proteolytic subunit n=1 Tax=Paraclostridium bifermentans ATCC 638 = DSM 14991 TaxID=1233171 RepID=T4VQF3_PARBF|nr:head maturation protease, ClpP-related [Paraclostridium bifermentans]EQK42917.1 clp protease family protein [[Clostridium] bifermentans ATCC 638] [Paraclostridium bifermentans ATCC 638 = DSM 14991]RIZ58046.1 peptidase [Paraclostridium bifermentans]UAG16801.1 Clp protease ClpP [Paraclostridium bifermentans]
MKNRKDNLSDLLKVKNQTETSADLYFYGDIVSTFWDSWDDTDQYPEQIKSFLDEVKDKSLNIYINSPGGSVFAGQAIYNMLKRHKGYKTVYVDGLAASIASVIAMAGDKIIIPSNAQLMIHKPWLGTFGNANDLREQADVLDKIEEGILNVYQSKIKEGIDIETIKEMVNKETWLTGEEASKYFDVEVSDKVNIVASYKSDYLNKFTKIPKELKQIENKNEDEKEKLLIELDFI